MADRLVTVFGGSGFVGRHLVKRLAAAGNRVCVAVRDVESAHFLKPMGDVGQIVPMLANVRDEESVWAAVQGADAVVFLVGILFGRGHQTFKSIHVAGAERVARAAVDNGVQRFIHISALGADLKSDSAYARTKALGEERVKAAYPEATIMRPSVVFGAEDQFFNRLAALARLSPILPIFGQGLLDAGRSRVQPIFVGDVGDAIVNVLDDPSSAGETYELGGPRIYSYREIMELVSRETGRKRLLVPVPYFAAKMKAAFLELLPCPPLTRDQLKLLATDNVVGENAKGLAELGVAPTSVEAIVPRYLKRYRRRTAQEPAISD